MLDDALRAELTAVIKEFKARFVAGAARGRQRMPSLIDIRRRIRSVQNTQQITKAMKMVSAAKLRRAQDRVIAARPYAAVLRERAGQRGRGGRQRTNASPRNPLLARRPEKRIQLVLITARQGPGRRLQHQPDQSRAALRRGAPAGRRSTSS